jgi:hypothetical protein
MRSAALWMMPTVLALAAAASASPPRLRSLAPAAIQQFGGWGADEYERQFKDRPVKFSVDVNNSVGFYDGGDHSMRSTGEARWGIFVVKDSELATYNMATDGKRLFVVTRNRPYRPPLRQFKLFAIGD